MHRTTDKYVKVKKQADKAPENEIRIRAVPRIGRYISYAAALLMEKKLDAIIIKASGNATKSACQIAEILRHRLLGLHQLNLLKTIPVLDEYEPKEEGLDRVVVERKLAVLEIHLSLKEGILDTRAAGYQAPLPKDQVQEEELKSLLEGRGKRGGDDHHEGGERRGGRGRGRGFRRGRYAGGRGGRRGGFRGDRDRDDRDYRDDREHRGGDREHRGGDRGYGRDNRGYRDDRDDREHRGGDREHRGGDRGYGRGDRGYGRGGSRGGRRGGSRGGYREQRSEERDHYQQGGRRDYNNRTRGERRDKQ